MESEIIKTVLVFKTNVYKKSDAGKIVKLLNKELPNTKANFDLDDCDKILRVESTREFNIEKLQMIILHLPFEIKQLI